MLLRPIELHSLSDAGVSLTSLLARLLGGSRCPLAARLPAPAFGTGAMEEGAGSTSILTGPGAGAAAACCD